MDDMEKQYITNHDEDELKEIISGKKELTVNEIETMIMELAEDLLALKNNADDIFNVYEESYYELEDVSSELSELQDTLDNAMI